MADITYVSESKLLYFKQKIDNVLKNYYVGKEYKTGSSTQYKVLSDNNLTDELLQKLLNAGDSSFSGVYGDLTGIPTFNGVKIEGTLTDTILNVALKSELPGIASATKTGLVKVGSGLNVDGEGKIDVDFTGYATTDQIPGLATSDTPGIVKPDGTTITVTAGVIKAELGAYATTAAMEQAIQEAVDELEEKIGTKISSIYTPKGSSTFASLPTPAATNVGEVYNVTDAFVTTDQFVEGAGKSYPAGTNVAIVEATTGTYKYDALSGAVDLTNYVQFSNLKEISTTTIDGWFRDLVQGGDGAYGG